MKLIARQERVHIGQHASCRSQRDYLGLLVRSVRRSVPRRCILETVWIRGNRNLPNRRVGREERSLGLRVDIRRGRRDLLPQRGQRIGVGSEEFFTLHRERDLSLRGSRNLAHHRQGNTKHTQYRSLPHGWVPDLILADPHLSQSTVEQLVWRRGIR